MCWGSLEEFTCALFKTPLKNLPTLEIQVMKLLLQPGWKEILPGNFVLYLVLTDDALRRYLRRNSILPWEGYRVTVPTSVFNYGYYEESIPCAFHTSTLPLELVEACHYIHIHRANSQPQKVQELLQLGFRSKGQSVAYSRHPNGVN